MDELNLEHLSQSDEYCAVCNDVADGYHYGILSCRGCNAFFRRAITHNLNFQCRRGGNCSIDKNARCACRACRLRKCIKVGMEKGAVQPRRDGKPLPKEHPSLLTASTSRNASDECGSVESFNKSSPSLIGSPNNVFTPLNPSVSFLLQTSSSTTHSPQNSSACALTRMVDDYFEQRRRRRAMLCNTLEELLADDGNMHLKRPATPEDYSAIYRVQMVLMFEWAEKLDEFKAITNPHDKAKLLRLFSMKYLLLDNIFHSIELNCSDRIVLVNNTYIQQENMPIMAHTESRNSQEALKMMYGESCVNILDELIRPMMEMNITFGEILALRLIIFWNPGSCSGLCHETVEIIQKASKQAIEELHKWYEENKVNEIKTRIANVLLMLSPLAKHTQTLIELSKLINNFGVLAEWDSFLNDLLR
ncbi:Nuclear hormone receptor family member nhr-49 [Aphelenchoides bicaudatus]|nr:Nuclear hormone receptor family member nhr-49 [Aphelenchoides bicaudatus]